MDANILCTLISKQVNADRFYVDGVGDNARVIWKVADPTPEELAIVADVLANYETLAAAYKPRVEVLTMRQARLQMLAMGVLSQVEAAVAQAGDAAGIEWEYAQTVERDYPLFLAIKGALGFTDEQEETFFSEGSLL
jgi:hypothetical protein